MYRRRFPPTPEQVRRAVEEVFDRVVGGVNEVLGEVEPASELIEDEGRYVFRVEMPGLNRDQIEVFLEDDYLVVQGERKEEGRPNRYYSEIRYGRVRRKIRLPSDASREGLNARLHRGVLEIEIPREGGARRSSIPVQEILEEP